MTETLIGRTKWMDPVKGYGFIVNLESNEEIFIHYSHLKRSSRGYRTLYPNEYVSFTLETNSSGQKIATNVTGVKNGPLMCEHYSQGPPIYNNAYKPAESQTETTT